MLRIKVETYATENGHTPIHDRALGITRGVLPALRDSTLNKNLILLKDKSNRISVIEGNHRAVGMYMTYFVDKSLPFEPHEVFLGSSLMGCRWNGTHNHFLPSIIEDE